MIEFWNLHKTLWSLVLFLSFGLMQPQAVVPVFESPAVASVYLQTHCVYTGDFLLGGVIDIVNSPTRLQAAMEKGHEEVKQMSVDCDDYAAWAFVAVRNMKGVPTLYTLKDSSGKFGHHVVTTYLWQGQQGVIDTNGHRVLNDTTPVTLCAVFTSIYQARGYRYTEAIVTACPF